MVETISGGKQEPRVQIWTKEADKPMEAMQHLSSTCIIGCTKMVYVGARGNNPAFVTSWVLCPSMAVVNGGILGEIVVADVNREQWILYRLMR